MMDIVKWFVEAIYMLRRRTESEHSVVPLNGLCTLGRVRFYDVFRKEGRLDLAKGLIGCRYCISVAACQVKS